MKKYFCKTCGKFKNIFEVKFETFCHPEYLVPVCKWCHEKNVVTSEDIIEELFNRENN